MSIPAEVFMTELAAKHRAAIDRVADAYMAAVDKEGFGVPEVIKVELKNVIETAEIAALWVSDSEQLDVKLALAEQCGDGARQYRLLHGRLVALGVDLGGYDPRQGGYSKLFAFLRSLQTTEERASAGQVTGKTISMARAARLAAWCEQKGDPETARLFGETLRQDDLRHHEAGRQALAAVAIGEESQARGRRAAYKVIELANEMQEPASLRKVFARAKR